MKYIIVDAELGGTGLKDKYSGEFISIYEIKISKNLKKRIKKWLSRYELAHYGGFKDEMLIQILDTEGKLIATLIKGELRDVKVDYFSDAIAKFL